MGKVVKGRQVATELLFVAEQVQLLSQQARSTDRQLGVRPERAWLNVSGQSLTVTAMTHAAAGCNCTGVWASNSSL